MVDLFEGYGGPLSNIHMYPGFNELIADKDFQKELYSSITNTQWLFTEYDEKQRVYDVLKGNNHEWSVSFRHAANLISKLYNKHVGDRQTSYIDFYLLAPGGVVSDRVEVIFNSLGWKRDPNYS